MTIEGVDFANERPSGAALMAAGKRFVVRYLSPNTTGNPRKKLTAAEVADYRGAGLAIAVVWETTTSRARDGRAAGIADANSAVASAAGLGFPAGQPIYFAVDEDTSGSAVAEYFRGVASVIGVARTGVYGSYRVVKYLMANGLCKYGWQTYAWSGGQWYGPAQAQQYNNGEHVAGTPAGMYLDLCRATTSDYGQWPPPGEENDMTPQEMLAAPVAILNPANFGGAAETTVGQLFADMLDWVYTVRQTVRDQAADITALDAKIAAIPTTAVPAGPMSDADKDDIAKRVVDLIAARVES